MAATVEVPPPNYRSCSQSRPRARTQQAGPGCLVPHRRVDLRYLSTDRPSIIPIVGIPRARSHHFSTQPFGMTVSSGAWTQLNETAHSFGKLADFARSSTAEYLVQIPIELILILLVIGEDATAKRIKCSGLTLDVAVKSPSADVREPESGCGNRSTPFAGILVLSAPGTRNTHHIAHNKLSLEARPSGRLSQHGPLFRVSLTHAIFNTTASNKQHFKGKHWDHRKRQLTSVIRMRETVLVARSADYLRMGAQVCPPVPLRCTHYALLFTLPRLGWSALLSPLTPPPRDELTGVCSREPELCARCLNGPALRLDSESRLPSTSTIFCLWQPRRCFVTARKSTVHERLSKGSPTLGTQDTGAASMCGSFLG